MIQQVESEEQRVERLRKSVTWAEEHGQCADVIRWRSHYFVAAKRLSNVVTSYYVLLEDFVSVLVGPFATHSCAVQHIVFAIRRQDKEFVDRPYCIDWQVVKLTADDALEYTSTKGIELLTEAEDRVYNPSE